jgi:hypothetical protein
MKLVQIYDPKKGYRAGRIDGNKIYPVFYEEKKLSTVLDLVEYATAIDLDLTEVVDELTGSEAMPLTLEDVAIAPDSSRAYLAIPIHPPEVWACGVT